MPIDVRIPTRVTQCSSCFKAGLRKDGEPLDARCRYCGGEVQTMVFESRSKARQSIRAVYNIARRQRVNGQIRTLKPGYGFIHGEDRTDYFFLPRDILAQDFSKYVPGDSVEFMPTTAEKGPRAIAIRRPPIDRIAALRRDRIVGCGDATQRDAAHPPTGCWGGSNAAGTALSIFGSVAPPPPRWQVSAQPEQSSSSSCAARTGNLGPRVPERHAVPLHVNGSTCARGCREPVRQLAHTVTSVRGRPGRFDTIRS